MNDFSKSSPKTLKDLPAKRGEVLELIKAQFSPGEAVEFSPTIDIEFSLLLEEGNSARIFFLLDTAGEKVAAALAYRIFEMRLPDHPGETLRVAALGLVVTDPSFRLQGAATRLLETAELAALNEGATICWLWAEKKEFYEKRGYLLCGLNAEWDLSKVSLPPLTANAAPPQRVKDFGQILPLYEKLGVGPQRSASLYNRFLKCPNTELFFAGSPQLVRGYAFCGKGRDLRHVVHECGGEISSVLQLLAQLKKSGAKKLHHSYDTPLFPALQQSLGLPEKQVLGFAKVLRPPELLSFVQKSRHFPSQYSAAIGKKTWTIHQKGADKKIIFESPDPGHILQLFFGPWSRDEMEDLSPVFHQPEWKKLKALPLYFWGLDCV